MLDARLMNIGGIVLCAGAAAFVLWRKWHSGLYMAAKSMKDHKVTIDNLRKMSFEELSAFLRDPKTTEKMTACVCAIHDECVRRHGNGNPGMLPMRKIMAAYLVVFFRSKVFENLGPLERALLDSSVDLTKRLEDIVNAVCRGGSIPHRLSSNFSPMVAEYLARFTAWKIPDERRVIGRLKHALLELYQAERLLDGSNIALQREFTTQIGLLREKLRAIAGGVALAAFDNERSSLPVPSSFPACMCNERLVHALLYDPGFEIGDDMCFSWEDKEAAICRGALDSSFWSMLMDDFIASRSGLMFKVLENICSGISETNPREEIYVRVVLNVERFKQLEEDGLFGWDVRVRVLQSVVEIIRRTQNPRRDPEFSSAWRELPLGVENSRTMHDALKLLLGQVNKMRVDTCNERLRLLSPVVCANGFDYEREKFNSRLQSGAVTLDRTTAWVDAVIAVNRDEIPSLVVLKFAAAFKRVFVRAVVSTVASAVDVTEDNCPETLVFDAARLANMQSDFRATGVSAAVLEDLILLHTVPADASLARIAGDVNLLVAVSWGVHEQTYTRVIGDAASKY